MDGGPASSSLHQLSTFVQGPHFAGLLTWTVYRLPLADLRILSFSLGDVKKKGKKDFNPQVSVGLSVRDTGFFVEFQRDPEKSHSWTFGSCDWESFLKCCFE